MADTNFVSGTVITKEWLNEVNRTVYDLPSTTSGKGSALIGYSAAAAAPLGTVAGKLRESVSATEHGGADTGLVDDSVAEANAFSVANSIRSIFRSLWMYKFPRRGIKVWRATFGIKDQAAVVSIFSNPSSSEPDTQVLGFSSPSDVSVYGNRDSVALNIEQIAPPPVVTTAATTFTPTSVTSIEFASAIAAGNIKLGMMIDTNESPKKTGTIDGVIAGTNTITVSNWYIVDGTRTTATPANGVTVYVNPITKIWGINANVYLNPDSHGSEASGFEYGLVNNKGPGLGSLFDAVNLGPYSGAAAFQCRYAWNIGYAAYSGHTFGFMADTGAGGMGFFSQGSPQVGFQTSGAQEGIVIKQANAGLRFKDVSNNVLSEISGAGILSTAKVQYSVYTDGQTIGAGTVIANCLNAGVATINLPAPGGNNTNRLLYLKNSVGSAANTVYFGPSEGGGGGFVVTPGASKTVFSDGSAWIPI